MGAAPLQIVVKVLLPKRGQASCWAYAYRGKPAWLFGDGGAVGGGGLGDLGIRFGYQRFMPEVMAAVVLLLIVLVQAVQTLGEGLARRANKRIRRD